MKVTYKETDDTYYIYDNNTVKSISGTVICLNGLTCLKEYL